MKGQPKAKSVDVFFDEKFRERNFVKAYGQVEPLMDIAFAIVQARNDAGLSQADLAKKLKTSQSVVSRIENGNQNLSVKMISKIAKALGCSLSVDLKSFKEKQMTESPSFQWEITSVEINDRPLQIINNSSIPYERIQYMGAP